MCAAEKVPGDLGGLELGSLRSFSVAEALLCTELGGPLFAARVARSLALSDHHSPFTRLLQKAKALKLYIYTKLSVTAFLSAPVFGAHPALHKLGSPEDLEEHGCAQRPWVFLRPS